MWILIETEIGVKVYTFTFVENYTSSHRQKPELIMWLVVESKKNNTRNPTEVRINQAFDDSRLD